MQDHELQMRVIFIIGTHDGSATVHDGRFLKKYYPPAMTRDGWEGGCIESTDSLDDALKFPDAGAAWLCYRRQNGIRPYDGKPNRPLTAWNVEISPVEVFMDRQKVDSSNIDSVGYEPGPPAVMEIQFKGGGVYQYRSAEAGVVEQHYQDLMKAESKGRHFTSHVRHDKRLVVTRVDKSASGEGGQAAG